MIRKLLDAVRRRNAVARERRRTRPTFYDGTETPSYQDPSRYARGTKTPPMPPGPGPL